MAGAAAFFCPEQTAKRLPEKNETIEDTEKMMSSKGTDCPLAFQCTEGRELRFPIGVTECFVVLCL